MNLRRALSGSGLKTRFCCSIDINETLRNGVVIPYEPLFRTKIKGDLDHRMIAAESHVCSFHRISTHLEPIIKTFEAQNEIRCPNKNPKAP